MPVDSNANDLTAAPQYLNTLLCDDGGAGKIKGRPDSERAADVLDTCCNIILPCNQNVCRAIFSRDLQPHRLVRWRPHNNDIPASNQFCELYAK